MVPPLNCDKIPFCFGLCYCLLCIAAVVILVALVIKRLFFEKDDFEKRPY